MDMCQRFEELIRENERLKRALKPFADVFDKQWREDSRKANSPPSQGGGSWPKRNDTDPMTVNYGDCQEALSAIQPK